MERGGEGGGRLVERGGKGGGRLVEREGEGGGRLVERGGEGGGRLVEGNRTSSWSGITHLHYCHCGHPTVNILNDRYVVVLILNSHQHCGIAGPRFRPSVSCHHHQSVAMEGG